MLEIILLLLKIAGIILLCLVGLLLTLILLVLFVPVRYYSKGHAGRGQETFAYDIRGRVSWLCRIISINICVKDTMPDKFEYRIKVFGITLNKKSEGDRSLEEKESNRQENDKQQKPEKSTQTDRQEVEKIHESVYDSSKISKTDNAGQTQTNETVTEKQAVVKAVAEENKKKEKKIFKIFENINKLCDRIKKYADVKNKFVSYLKKQESKEAIRKIRTILFKAVRHVLPVKFMAEVNYGFDDPATTGKITGYASLLYGLYGESLDLRPDFENQVLDVNYVFKGRIRVIVLLIAAFRLYKNKWIREFITFSKKMADSL